ncbi:hypothetical protein [Spirosoma pomorum]
MMQYVNIIIHFLQGTYAKFGTTSNLVREISVSVLTAVAVAVLVQLLTPQPASELSEVRVLIQAALHNQRQADSLQAEQRVWKLQRTIDSLLTAIHYRDEQDSLRANAGLSPVDAMDKVNRAIGKSRH